MKRRTARETALQALFQVDVSEIEPNEAIQHALDGKDSDEFMEKLVYGTIQHQEELDTMIIPHLVNWTIDRLANVDRGILRMSAYELKYEEEIPSSVTLDEAIELAKTFGDDGASSFVNGVLSSIKDDLEK